MLRFFEDVEKENFESGKLCYFLGRERERVREMWRKTKGRERERFCLFVCLFCLIIGNVNLFCRVHCIHEPMFFQFIKFS